SWPRLRDSIAQQLSAPGCRVDDRMLRGADEVALALFDVSGGTTANSLVLVDTGSDHADARRRSCGAVSAQYVGRWLAIGQPASLRAAAALAAGRGRSLAEAPAYRRATNGLPAGRVADAWVSRDGVRRLLEPQGGVLAAAGALLDRPGLVGAAAAVDAGEDRATLTVRSVADGLPPARPIDGRLASAVPEDALAYVGARGLGPALASLLGVTGGGGQGLVRAAGALRGALPDLRRALGAALDGEVALVLTPNLPAPTLTLIGGAGDEAATRRALRRAEAPLLKALLGRAAGRPGSPAFRGVRVAGADARVLRVAGLQLAYAVFDGRLVASTRLDGIAKVRAAGGSIEEAAGYRATVGETPRRAGSLVFLDFSQLLRLGEQTGLNDSRAYQAVKADLQEVRAVGGSTSRAGDVTTATLVLSIP
ncbi:MAG TPA: hypothetical protein VLA98_00925, partial [Solirubrobacteraceae bacterium]|nr:hypothetical protein [Solirubrobacteraceae bacterium]